MPSTNALECFSCGKEIIIGVQCLECEIDDIVEQVKAVRNSRVEKLIDGDEY